MKDVYQTHYRCDSSNVNIVDEPLELQKISDYLSPVNAEIDFSLLEHG